MFLQLTLNEIQEHINKIPINQYLQLKVLEVNSGNSRIMMPYNPVLTNTWGTTHGGALMTLCDVVFFVALVSLNGIDASGKTSTLEIKTNFLNPVRESNLYAEAKIIKNGRRSIFGEVNVYNEANNIICHSTATYLKK